MEKIISFIKSTVVKGVFFLIPIGVFLIVIEKVLHWTQQLIHILIRRMPAKSIAGITLYDLFGILLLLVCCFVAGAFAGTSVGGKMIANMENKVLSRIPGYSFLINMGQSMLGLGDHSGFVVVIVRFDDCWQIGFLVDEIDQEKVLIYLPGSPTLLAGKVIIVSRGQIKKTNLKQQQAIQLMAKMGKDGGKLFETTINRYSDE